MVNYGGHPFTHAWQQARVTGWGGKATPLVLGAGGACWPESGNQFLRNIGRVEGQL